MLIANVSTMLVSPTAFIPAQLRAPSNTVLVATSTLNALMFVWEGRWQRSYVIFWRRILKFDYK